MTTSLTKQWITFFKDAGITNTKSAALYASTFAENELQVDMVGDLTREILKELNITLMGHVLAILKHAKLVHQEAVTDKIVAKTTYTSLSTSVVSPFAESPPEEIRPKKSTIAAPAMRMIDHYVQRPSSDIDLTPPQQVRKTNRLGSVKQQVASTSRIKDRLSVPIKASSTSALKVTDRLGLKRVVQTMPKKEILINEDVVPVKRIRRVLPEEEGGYKITMPSGTTPKTKQLLSKQQYFKSKATVFERLGGSDSSSESEPKVIITGLGGPLVKSGKSVFSRLGDRNEVTSTVTSDEPPLQTRLGYHGVLKTDAQSPPKPQSAVSRISGMKQVGFEATVKPSALSRLGKSTSGVTFRADSSQSSLGSGVLAKPITKKKKFMLIKKTGAREIVYRDVPVQPPAPKRTFDAATRNMFRSDNIAVVPRISSRIGQSQIVEDEQEWDY